MKKQSVAKFVAAIAIGTIGISGANATGAFAAIPKTAISAAAASKKPLGDISKFRTITVDTLAYAKAGDVKKAEKRITDMEKKWDAYANALQKRDKASWTKLDLALDKVLKSLRASKPDAKVSATATQEMLTLIDSMS